MSGRVPLDAALRARRPWPSPDLAPRRYAGPSPRTGSHLSLLRRSTVLTLRHLAWNTVGLQRKRSECVMILILGLIILIAAIVVGVAGVLGNGGTHGLARGFSVLGFHVTGSGTVFLYGIAVGAIALFGLWLLLTGARRTSRRGSAARRGLRQSRRETAQSRQETAAVSKARDD